MFDYNHGSLISGMEPVVWSYTTLSNDLFSCLYNVLEVLHVEQLSDGVRDHVIPGPAQPLNVDPLNPRLQRRHSHPLHNKQVTDPDLNLRTPGTDPWSNNLQIDTQIYRL